MILPTAEAPLVGGSRHALVSELVEAVRRVERSETPEWWSLEAPSGWGKTRILRELYQRLAANQSSPAYWPPSILGATRDDVSSVEARRRRVAPEVVHRPPGALPDWFWWGITCELAAGPSGLSLQRNLTQIESHGPWLEQSWREVVPFARRQRGSLVDTVREVSAEVAPDAADLGLSMAGASVPLIGPLWSLSRWLLSRAADERARRRLVDQGATIDVHESGDLVSDVVSAITRLAKPGLPVVIVVEDFHRADQAVITALRGILDTSCSVLIVTTAWPADSEEAGPVAQLKASVPTARIVHVAATTAHSASDGHASMDQLQPAELAQILRYHYPETDDATTDRVVARYTNPLALELMCTLPRTRRHAAGGALVVEDDELNAIPSGVAELYESRWRDLSHAEQERLVVCAWAVPSTFGATDVSDEVWDEDLISTAVRSLSAEAALVDLEGGLAGWIRHVRPGQGCFHEPLMQDIALRDPTDLFSTLDRESFLRSLGRAAIGADGHDLDVQTRFTRAQLIVALFRNGHITPERAVVEACHVLARGLLNFPNQGQRVSAITEVGIAAAHTTAAPVEDIVLELRVMGALARKQHGLTVGAVEVWRSIVAEYEQKRGDTASAEFLHARTRLAEALAASGDVESALSEARAAAQEAEERFGRGSPEAVTASGNLGYHLASSGRHFEAVALLRQVLEAREAMAAAPEQLLSTRHTLAQALATGGAPDGIPALAAVAHDASRILGAKNPSSLLYRLTEALHLATAWRNEEAAELLEPLIADLREVLGPGHEYVLCARERHAVLLSRMGDHSRGIALLQELLHDMQAARGIEDPMVGTLLTNLGFVMNATGDFSGALATLRRAVERSERHTGPDSMETAIVVYQLGLALTGVGRLREAERCFERAATGAVLHRGPQSDDALTARIRLQQVRSGSVDRLLSEGRTLVADILAVNGPRDADEMQAFANFASLLMRTGNFEAAVEVLRSRVTAPAALDLQARSAAMLDLAAGLRAAGRTGEAEAAGARARSLQNELP